MKQTKIAASWSIDLDGYRRAWVGEYLLVTTNHRTDRGWGPVRWAVFQGLKGPRVAEGSVYQGSEYQALVRQAMLNAERAAARFEYADLHR
jgi:hypothetical protein